MVETDRLKLSRCGKENEKALKVDYENGMQFLDGEKSPPLVFFKLDEPSPDSSIMQ